MRDSWYARADALARARGDRDIETPRGDLRGGRRILELAQRVEDGSVAAAVAKRAFLHQHAFASDFARRVWEMHVEHVSNREIARHLAVNRKTIDRHMRRLLLAFERRDAPRRGRPRNPESLRSEGVRLSVRLSRTAAQALDHIRVALGIGEQDAVRLALQAAARDIMVGPKFAGRP